MNRIVHALRCAGHAALARALILASVPKIKWQLAARSKNAGDVFMIVPMRKLDQLWSRDQAYLGPHDDGIVEHDPLTKTRMSRRAKTLRYVTTTPEPVPLYAPEVSFHDGKVMFTNGRHRVAVMRELGAQKLAVAVPKENADDFMWELGGHVLKSHEITL